MGCGNYTLCSALGDQIGLTSYFGAGLEALAPNSMHATVFGSKGSVAAPPQVPEFVANVFGNRPDYMKIISDMNGFDQTVHDALVSTTHALGKVSMAHAQDYGSYEVAIFSKTNGINMCRSIFLSRRRWHNSRTTVAIRDADTKHREDCYGKSDYRIDRLIWSELDIRSWRGHFTTVAACGCFESGGTDANDYSDSFLEGDTMRINLHRESRYLTEAGLSEVDALGAATVVPSRWHNLTGRGSIGGMSADNISQKMNIARVWNGGIEYMSTAGIQR